MDFNYTLTYWILAIKNTEIFIRNYYSTFSPKAPDNFVFAYLNTIDQNDNTSARAPLGFEKKDALHFENVGKSAHGK